MATIERSKKSRSVLRRSFTTTANELKNLFAVDGYDVDQVHALMGILTEKRDRLCEVDRVVYELLIDSDASDEVIDAEMQATDEYNFSFKSLSLLYDKIAVVPVNYDADSVRSNSTHSSHNNNANSGVLHRLKLPVIEFKKFGGDIRDWLSFWGQFQKINDDRDLSNEDKFQYLIQAMLPGTRARELIDSFPPTGENYVKAIDCLKARFGREDLLIEVYVRDFLKIILTKVSCASQKTNLSSLYDKIETKLRALGTLGVTTKSCSAILYPLVESCLPEELLRAWQRSTLFSRDSTRENCLDQLMTFLRGEVENDERINLASEGFGLTVAEGRERKVKAKSDQLPTAASLLSFAKKCLFCDADHESSSCLKGQKLSLTERRKIVSQKRACFNCLKIGHISRKCHQKLCCLICNGSHVPLMCDALPQRKDIEPSTVKASAPEKKPEGVDQSLSNISDRCIFMQTLQVIVRSNVYERIARVIIDTGSQRSYVLKTLANELACPVKRQEKIIHALFGGSKTKEQEHSCYDIRLMSLDRSYACTFEVLDQPIICENITPIVNGPWISELKSKRINLSDVGKAAPIEILIGADVAGKLLTGKKYTLKDGLVALETYLGWSLMGKTPVTSTVKSTTMTVASLISNDVSMSQLWQLDVLGIEDATEKRSRDEMNAAVNEHFLNTVAVDNTGRYIVHLPWKEGHPPLGNNYNLAKKRLEGSVSKLRSNKMLVDYGHILQEWTDLDIIEPVLTTEVDDVEGRIHYLPHRAVVKPGSSTCKIRPVFDASSHEKNQPSINDCLESGPNLIEIIPSLLLRFRIHCIGVIADIEKAFLQIVVAPTDRDFFRFIWQTDGGNDVIYRHKRVVFGVCCSPYLLGMTIKYHLQRMFDINRYSTDMLRKLDNAFYVDNCVASVADTNALQLFMSEATAVMQEAHFNLRGWEHTISYNVTSESTITNLLGLLWDKLNDSLSVNVEICAQIGELSITKRTILSVVHKIYDPIGFTCPVTVLPKLLLQRTWKQKTGWDDPLDSEIQQEFLKWRDELSCLTQISIPRWIGYQPGCIQKLSLHTFCDASVNAYAAIVYLRIETANNVHINLLGAKTRISPLKSLSIPRLELLAATIAARLYCSVRKILEVELEGESIDSYFWSDSSTAISWIKREDQWSTFVWNRAVEIRSLTDKDRWRHVPGCLNPADLPSRGCLPKRLLESKWWEGPKWLLENESTWSFIDPTIDEEVINSERKKKIVASMLSGDSEDLLSPINDRFSHHYQIVNVFGWILRFVRNCQQPQDRISDSNLSAEELDRAEKKLVTIIQRESFSDDKTKELKSLCPFVDDEGIIRLKTKVSYREDLTDFRYPILLPARHPVVQKLIFDTHIRSCHVGVQTLQGLLREHYWILGGRRSIKSVISKCVRCRRFDSRKLEEPTPPLPSDRVRDASIFEVIGIDMAGPLYLKRSQKVWVCVFTCAVYRAVHFEVVTALSTDIFLLAFRRFIARRGRPRIVYTDNGTNFTGAENAFSKLDWEVITKNSDVPRISWRFNPPSAAWWGGFWERMVSLLKQLLRKVLGRALLNYEELLTVLCDCESMINSRPITYVTSNPSELSPITPNMFLQELREVGVPDLDNVDRDTLQRRVLYRDKLRNDLRRRFRSEYLGQLKLSSEKGSRQISLGELVFIGNDQSKRLEWPLGVVEELIPSKDGRTRLVRLRTAAGQLLRPIQRLFPLELSGSTDVREAPEGPDSCSREYVPNVSCAESDDESVEFGNVDSASKVDRRGRVIKVPQRLLL